MKTTVSLTNMRFYAYHGVAEQERTVGNWFSVSVKLSYPFKQAMESDDVADTINYAEVYEVVKREMLQPSRLLEHVAGRIHRALMEAFPAITGGVLTVAKLNPPIPNSTAAATIELAW